MYQKIYNYTLKVNSDGRDCRIPLKRCSNFCECPLKIGGSRTINIHRIDLDIFVLLIHMQQRPLNKRVTADKTT